MITKESSNNYIITLQVFRAEDSNSYIISSEQLSISFYTLNQNAYEVELYKDFYIAPGLFSSLNRIDTSLAIVASIFAEENDYQDCLMLNSNKNVIGSTNASVFLRTGKQIKTPPITDGVKNRMLDKKLLIFLKSGTNLIFKNYRFLLLNYKRLMSYFY